jgi:monomeric isocitrate dehydrogenase
MPITSSPLVTVLDGDQTFAMVNRMVIGELITPFLGEEAVAIEPWGLKERIYTQGQIIPDAVARMRQHPERAVVKLPGATATEDQLSFTLQSLGMEVPPTPDAMRALKNSLAGGASPNAYLRGGNGMDACVVRYPATGNDLVQPLETHWNSRSPVQILTLDRGRAANAQQVEVDGLGDERVTVPVTFFAEGEAVGKPLTSITGEPFTLTPGSVLDATHVKMADAEALIRQTFQRVLDEATPDSKPEIWLASKGTVLKDVDAAIQKRAQEIYKTEFQSLFQQQGIPEPSLKDRVLVDDVFAEVLARGWERERPLYILCPDDSYGQQMQTVLEEVKQKGIHYNHCEHHIEIGRFSNGLGAEYGAVGFTPSKPGVLQVAGEVYPVEPGEMWMVYGNDVKAARDYATRMIDHALGSNGRVSTIYFGFDETNPRERPLVDAIRQVLDERQQEMAEAGLQASIENPALITARMLTEPQNGVLLALDNLWGDIVADSFPRLANSHISYDSVLISDKGLCIETGAGGTAPDLLYGRYSQMTHRNEGGLLQTGKLGLNPGAIISAYALAFRHSGRNMQQPEASRFGEDLSRAFTLAMEWGYVTPDLGDSKGGTRLQPDRLQPDATAQTVDTRVLIQAVRTALHQVRGEQQAFEQEWAKLQEMNQSLWLGRANAPLPDDSPLWEQAIALNIDAPIPAITGHLQAQQANQRKQR